MKIIKTLRAWHQDRRQVSMEKHEIDYVKKLAKKYLKDIEGLADHHPSRVRKSSLEKMCKYILKTKPETRR